MCFLNFNTKVILESCLPHLLPLNNLISTTHILPMVLRLQGILVILIRVWTSFLLTIFFLQIILLLILLFMRKIKFFWRLVRSLFLCHFTKTCLIKAYPLMLKARILLACPLEVLLDTDQRILIRGRTKYRQSILWVSRQSKVPSKRGGKRGG